MDGSARRRNTARQVIAPALSLVLLLLFSAAWGEVEVTASVDQEAISLDDVAQFNITVTGSGLTGLEEPTLPAASGVRVLGTSTQQSFSLTNGAMRSSYSFVYTLQPTRQGNLSIGPVSVRVGRRVYQTNPVSLRVTAGTGQGAGRGPGGGSQPPMSAMPNPFGPGPTGETNPQDAVAVRQTVDRKTAYVGQQITHVFAFYQGAELAGDISYRPAETPGFVTASLPNPPQANETLNGRPYMVQRRVKALFATAPGKHVIGQSAVTVQVDPFAGGQDLTADPITVTVLPLPQSGRPPGFGGAVGAFRLTLSADPQAVRSGETINLQAQVQGSGNIQSLGAPQLDLPAWVRVYQAGEKRKAEPGGGGDPALIGGTATFSYLVLPRQAGTLKIGPVAYPYFDPNSRSYRVAYSNALQIPVGQGTVAASESPAADSGLRPIRSWPGRAIGTPWALSPWFLGALGLPLLVVAWVGWQRWQVLAVVADPQQARARHALSLARKRLSQAESRLAAGGGDAGYAELHAALGDYIGDRLGMPSAGMTAESGRQRLLEAGCSLALADRAAALLERTAGGRFAPGGSDPQRARQAIRECADLVAALQKEVRPTHGGE